MASLGLEDSKTREIQGRWHFEFIRRYGFTKSRNLFTIEAGRRCETGEGSFDFHVVGNPKALTLAIDNALKTKQTKPLTSRLHMESENKEVAAKSRDSLKSNKRSSDTLTRKSSDSLKLEVSKDAPSEGEIQTPSTLQPGFKNSLEEKIGNHPTSPKPPKEGSTKEKKRGFSFPWKKDKGDKKENHKTQEGSDPSDLYDEPEIPAAGNKSSIKYKKSEPIYDEAVGNNNTAPSSLPPVYTEPQKARNEAWRKQGVVEEHHEEDYKKIKDAALKDGGNVPQIPERTYEGDEMYDRVDLKISSKGQRPKPTDSGEHIYGIGSGKNIEDIDDGDYASADFPENEITVTTSEPVEENDYEFENDDEDDTYADTINPSEEYADAVSCIRSQPLKERPQLYEDVS